MGVRALFNAIFEKEGAVLLQLKTTFIGNSKRHGMKVSFKVPPKGETDTFYDGSQVIEYIQKWSAEHSQKVHFGDGEDGWEALEALGYVKTVDKDNKALPLPHKSTLHEIRKGAPFFLSYNKVEVEVDKPTQYPGFKDACFKQLLVEWDTQDHELNKDRRAGDPKLRKVPLFGYSDLLSHAKELAAEEDDVARAIVMRRTDLNALEKKQTDLDLKIKKGREEMSSFKQSAMEKFANMVARQPQQRDADFEHRVSDLKPTLDKVGKLHSMVKMQVEELRVGSQVRDTTMVGTAHLGFQEGTDTQGGLEAHLEAQQKGIENLASQLKDSNNILQRLQQAARM